MVVRTKRDRNSNGWVFLKPLRLDLWMASLAFFCFTGFVVWAIEQRINPEFRGPPSKQFGIIFYFTFSTLRGSRATSVADLQRNGDYVGYELGSFVELLLRQLNFDRSRNVNTLS
ncbi:hypothetical protein Taro_034131 [Colocasia esculenta]|uniref:Uncharacterized protein n=1 Tax=Colocasia esculenta TaxID=4460 RepID=A0A843W921_COLES|nr:hypothetical protein [Colocasia esculenta]